MDGNSFPCSTGHLPLYSGSRATAQKEDLESVGGSCEGFFGIGYQNGLGRGFPNPYAARIYLSQSSDGPIGDDDR